MKKIVLLLVVLVLILGLCACQNKAPENPVTSGEVAQTEPVSTESVQEEVESAIKINNIENLAQAKIMGESKDLSKEEVPEELQNLTSLGGHDASMMYALYTKSDFSSEEFDLLHDYCFLFFDEANNKSIKISACQGDRPLRDCFFQETSNEISNIEGKDLKISKFEDQYIINFENNGYNFDINTSNLSEEEMVNLVKEIIH